MKFFHRYTSLRRPPNVLGGFRLIVLRGLLALMLMVSVFGTTGIADAGFGITPPYVRNDRLTRGTTYDQRIYLVRSDPVEDLKVQITMNIPGIESWFTIDQGTEFLMPKGMTQLPIVITVHVPKDAAYKDYTGAIRIRTSSANVSPGGGVTIALGAQVDVVLKVVDKIYDFDVRRVRMADLEAGYTKWGLYFPGKIRLFMTIENTGNTEFGPTSVKMDLYDSDSAHLLETTYSTNAIERIAPFTIHEVRADLPTHLSTGRYVAKYTIYKNADIAQQGELTLSISALGAVPGYEGYGFDGLSTTDKLKVVFALGVPLIIILGLIVALIARRRRIRRMRTQYGTTAL